MSPRAAWRLETLGFGDVADYTLGKNDWLSYNLPREGWGLVAGDVLREDVPTCTLAERVGEARARLGAFDRCVVVNDRGVVLGLARRQELAGDPSVPVERVMRPGPTTVRASEPLEGITERMLRRDVATVLVTTPEGTLMGLLDRRDAARALARAHRGAGPELGGPPTPGEAAARDETGALGER